MLAATRCRCSFGVCLLHQEPRMKLLFSGWIFFLQVLVISIAKPALAEVVNITLLHLSDIYEITLIEGGRGGLARVATNFNYTSFGDREKNLSAAVDKDQEFRAEGFVLEQAIATTNMALDGLKSSVRNGATNLTALIAQAMLREVDKADLAIFNSGSIQIDDCIPAKIITQYDILHILPFGGKVLAVEMNGNLLQKVLEQGQANRGTSGYLQTTNVSRKPYIGTCLVNGEPLEPNQKYRVAINDFLMSGKEKNLEFLNFKQPGVRLIAQKRDIRFAVIEQLRNF